MIQRIKPPKNHKHSYRPIGTATFRVYPPTLGHGIDQPVMVSACDCGDWVYTDLMAIESKRYVA